MSSEDDVIESRMEDPMFIESFSSPIAAEFFKFWDEEDAGGLFGTSEHQQDQLFVLPPYEDVSSSAPAAASAAADNSVDCYPFEDDASFSPLPSFCSLLQASPPPAVADQEPDLARYHSSSSSSSNPVQHTQPPPSAMFSLPPPALFVGDPFDHSGYSLDPSMVPPVSATGPPPQTAYEEESYATATGMGPPAGEMLGLEGAPPPFGFLDGIGMGAGALYCDGMLEPPPQGLFGGGMPALGPELGLMAPPGGDAAESGGLPPYGHDALPPAYGSGDMKVIGGGSQHLMGGCIGNPPSLPSSDIAASDDSSGKVGRLTAEERKEKITSYLKKRNTRNFSKKIKYACRKTLADSRPRVRGRFAKNDELGEVTRLSPSSHEFDDDEEDAGSYYNGPIPAFSHSLNS